jgi:hypothetical protein
MLIKRLSLDWLRREPGLLYRQEFGNEYTLELSLLQVRIRSSLLLFISVLPALPVQAVLALTFCRALDTILKALAVFLSTIRVLAVTASRYLHKGLCSYPCQRNSRVRVQGPESVFAGLKFRIKSRRVLLTNLKYGVGTCLIICLIQTAFAVAVLAK